jgi:hypothetical protein
MKKLLFVLALISAFAFTIAAQSTTGRLSGTVSGPDGALPGATVTATDNKTGKQLTVTSNEEGSFLFPQLEFGTYTVKVTASGFKTFLANDVKIDVGRDYTLPAALEIGDVSAEVVITAGADVVTASTAQVSSTVSPQQILSLPLLTRSPLTLTSLQAGVSANSAQLTTINGMRTTFTNITRDGINIQDQFIRTNATDFAPGRPSVDDTAEFTIALSNAEADQGYGGAQIRLVTPRGTKDFHGALFAYNRNSAFAANSFFSNRAGRFVATDSAVIQGLANVGDERTPRPFRNRNQFGGKASWRLPVPGFGEGTPGVFWDKGFFFFAYEGIRDPVSAVATRTVLSPNARAGAFTYNRTNSTDVTSFCPSQTIGSVCTIPNFLQFAQGVFPTGNIRSTISPFIQSNIIAEQPSSNFTGGDGLNTQGFRFNRGSDQTRDQYSTRIDVDINDRNTISGVFNYNDELNLRPDVDTSGYGVTPDVDQTSKNKQFTVSFRRVFTPTFINDFRVGFFGSEVPFTRTSPVPDFITAVPVANGANLVTTPLAFLNQGRNTKTFNLQSNADWILGNHSVKFGGQAQIFRVNATNDAQTVPVVTFGSGSATTFAQGNFNGIGGISTVQANTANGLLGLLGGQFINVTQFFNVATVNDGFQRGTTEFRPFRYENHALYVADRWQVGKGLTLNLGVRYELFPALRLNNGNALEPVIGDDLIGSLLDPNGTYAPIGGNAGRRNAYYKTDYDNFAPNLGVAWSPSFDKGVMGFLFGQSKTVIRGGYSHVYGNDSIVTSINNAAIGNFGLGRSGLQFAGLNERIDAGPPPVIPTPSIGTFPRTYLQNNAAGIGNFFGTVFAVDPNLQTPKVEQYSFGVQREIFGDMAFEIRYVGSRSNNLGRGIDLGQIDIVNNGFLSDFLRAQQNMRVSNPGNPNAGDPFCVAAGCVPLQIFQQAAGSPGRLGVAPTTGSTPAGTLQRTAFLNALTNGTPADLALLYINSTNPANLNNQPHSGAPGNIPRINFLPNNSTGVIDLFLNDGKYRYDSLQAEIRKRFSNGLYFQANYTYSKNLTNAVGTSQQLFEPYLDNNNQDLDWQRADFDTTHVFNVNGIYQLPFGRGKRFLDFGNGWDKLFGGWEISGLANWQSGAPITFVDTRGTLNRAGRSARQTPLSTLSNDEIQGLVGVFEQNGNIFFINPSILLQQQNPNGTFSSTASQGYSLAGAAGFNGQVFFNTQPGQTGNIGRALIDGPKFFNLNMAALKNIRFTESMRLQLRMEVFNVVNNVNFNISAAQQLANINSTTFGQITAVSTSVTPSGARELQFAARFEF